MFRSHFARFRLPLMDMEVMGDLQIRKNGVWQTVAVTEWKETTVGNLTVKLLTLSELKRILLLFGREKDLRRMALLGWHIGKRVDN